MEFILNQTSRRSIEKQTGLTSSQIVMMESGDLDRAIERKIKKQLSFSKKLDLRLSGRGSVYLSLKRFFDFNRKNLDRRIDSMSVE